MARIKFLALLLALPFLMGAGFNPGVYPGRYSTNGTALASDIIVGAAGCAANSTGCSSATHGPLLLVGCEWYNGNGSARSLMLFDSQTVPADGARAFKVFIANCPATTTCFWGNNGPSTVPGGVGVVFANGVTWANSSTFPSKTLGSADSTLACSYQQ